MSDKITLYDIKDFEPQEYVKVKHGQWIRDAENFGKYYCSECGFTHIPIGVQKNNYCPNCGARMEAEENGTD